MRLIDADAFERELMLTGDNEICEDCCYNFVNLLASQPTVGGWISVNDRLPGIAALCIIYAAGRMCVARYVKNNDWITGDKLFPKPTHWRSLPEPPMEGEVG